MLGEYKKAKFPKANKIPSGSNLSQIAISNSNKFFFMATGEQNLPGSIRISNYPLSNTVHEVFVIFSGLLMLILLGAFKAY